MVAKRCFPINFQEVVSMLLHICGIFVQIEIFSHVDILHWQNELIDCKHYQYIDSPEDLAKASDRAKRHHNLDPAQQ